MIDLGAVAILWYVLGLAFFTHTHNRSLRFLDMWTAWLIMAIIWPPFFILLFWSWVENDAWRWFRGYDR